MADKHSEGYQEALRRIDENYKTKSPELDLKGLGLTELPPEIGKLTHLIKLYLGYNSNTRKFNYLKTLPKEIGKLTKLQGLYLDCNQISELPEEIGQLTELQELALNSNQISEFPKEIGQLTKLQGLSLDDNQIRELPKEIGQLTNLKTLYLDGNQLSELPKEITRLTNLQELSLRGNPDLNIPPEIVERFTKPQVILNYYFENVYQVKEEDIRPLKEVKVLLVGQGRVGKTSLVRYLVAREKRNPDEETTHGIFRTPWKIDVVEAETGEAHNVQLNLWDFGGQDIMHATHEFFLTERSLYLLVLDAGLSKEANRLEYWLKKIQTYSQNAPVFIVINKSEANKLEIPLQTLQESYNIQGLFEVSCDNGFNIDVLEQKIKEQIGKMPEVFRRLSKNWFAVKEKLEKLEKDYISIEDYRRICSKHQVTDHQSQDTLLTYLNALGVMLNFREDNTKVLNPEWVTRGVYKLITSVNVRNNKAILTPEIMEREMESLNAELAKEGKEYLCYPPDKYEYIIKLMKKFELCYEIQGTEDFYIPGRLEEDKPADIGEWNEKECLGFRYDYGKGFLHESVMSRFIVKAHRKIFESKQWLTGVVLINERNNKALVRADLQKIREEQKIYQASLMEGLARREAIDINVNVFLYTKEREIKSIENRANSEDFARLQRLEIKKELLDAQADSVGSKKAIAVITTSVIVHIVSFVALILLIFVFSEDGWNKFEKWTFAIFLGLEIINLLGSLAFFIKTRQDFSWATYCSWMIEKQRTKLYLKNGIDENEIANLRNKLNESCA